jgi:pyruvate formate lyase activating enzyme
MPHKASYFQKLKNKIVKCNLCPNNCIIKPGQYGSCNARKNINGTLFSMVYGKPATVAVDPIEKKPLYHFFPGQKVFSIGTTGCNFHCDFCQNWSISQTKDSEKVKEIITPAQIVKEALRSSCKIIAYTYNEPTIFFEYVLEIAKLARKNKIRNVLVSNGFISKGPLEKLLPYIDAANIDLKSFDEDFYKKYCKAKLNPVLEALKTIKKAKVHLEITNLIIPQLNDDLNIINQMCVWISKNLGNNVPLHFSAFYPHYKMLETQPTSEDMLLKAKKIAEKNRLKYVYIGNVQTDNNTYCPKCKNLLVERNFYTIKQNNILDGLCKFCKEKIEGIWN